MAPRSGPDAAPRARSPGRAGRRSREPAMSRIFLGGAVGTVAITLMMYFVAPLLTGRSADLIRLLGVEIGNPHWLGGMVFHLFNGVILFPLGFAFLAGRWPGPWVVRGLIWGVIVWSLAQSVIMPMMGSGFFGYGAGGMLEAASSLAGHLVYGGLQGLIAGIPGREAD